MNIDEAVTLLQRGYDLGIAGTSRRRALERASDALRRVEEAPPGSYDRQIEERHVAAALAEEVGILVGLSAKPDDTLPGGRRVSEALARLLHLAGRSRALEERISEVVAQAYASGAGWKDIAEVLGMSEEEASEAYG